MTQGNESVANLFALGQNALRMCDFVVLLSPLLLIGRDRCSRSPEADPYVPGEGLCSLLVVRFACGYGDGVSVCLLWVRHASVRRLCKSSLFAV